MCRGVFACVLTWGRGGLTAGFAADGDDAAGAAAGAGAGAGAADGAGPTVFSASAGLAIQLLRRPVTLPLAGATSCKERRLECSAMYQ